MLQGHAHSRTRLSRRATANGIHYHHHDSAGICLNKAVYVGGSTCFFDAILREVLTHARHVAELT